MKIKIVILLQLLLILICSCNKEPTIEQLKVENGVIVNKPYIWKTQLSDGEWIGSFVTETAIYHDAILMGSMKGSIANISMVKIADGSILWAKPGYTGNDFCSFDFFYTYNENVVFPKGFGPGNSNLSLETGEYLWNVRRNGAFEPHVTGIDSFYFVCGPSLSENNPYKVNAAFFGKINKSDIQEFYFPNFEPIIDSSTASGYDGVQYILPCKNALGDILLVIYLAKYYPLPGKAYYCLYNFTKKQIIYENKPMISYLTGPPVIYDDRIYNATSYDISCIDLLTGEIIWVNNQYGGFSSYGFAIGENKILTLCEGTDPKSVIAYNLETGSIAWKTESHGTISPMRFLNGVVYFTSSGDGCLHAINASNGNYLWHIKSPDLKINSGDFFKPECNIIPGIHGEKGKIIVSSYLSGICYEAEK